MTARPPAEAAGHEPADARLGRLVWSASGAWLRRYHRHEIHLDAPLPSRPAVVVSNHGFGGVVDLNVLALKRVLLEHADHPTTFLVHSIAWTLGVGGLVERMDGRPADHDSAVEAHRSGRHLAIFPGGDVDAGKSWRDRNTITFSGRTGYASLARELAAPIVPVVTAGAGESLLVLDDGQGLARRLGLPRLLRLKALPTSVSIPWGLNVGMVGLLPYLPLPTKLHTAVLPSVEPTAEETDQQLAHRVESAMQARLDELVAGRFPIIG